MRRTIRVSAFVRKELVELLRQPRLVVTLVLGPFLLLLAFGAGLRDSDPPVRTLFVAPEDGRLAEEVHEFAAAQQNRLTVLGVTTDEQAALERLRRGELQMVVVIPDPPTLGSGEQAAITLYHDELDPLEGQALRLFARTAVDELNQQVLASAIGAVQDEVAEIDEADARVVQRFLELDPQVVVTPFRERVTSLVSTDLTHFYAPAAVVLLLQHLVVTFLGLSMVREVQLGTTELFRVAPLTPGEHLVGKVLAYLLIGVLVAALLLALLVVGLGVPLLGTPAQLAGAVLALLFAATALGVLGAQLARSDSQAVQYAMLVLLATIFFSGFLLTLERFAPPLRLISWVLPATHGMSLLRDVMLRGRAVSWTEHAALVVLGLLFLAASWLLLRRRERAA